MKAGLRASFVVVAGALAILSLPALAQNTAAPPIAPPPADTVGPRELQNFSLPGQVTRSSEQPPAEQSTSPSPRAPTDRAVVPPRRVPQARERSQPERSARTGMPVAPTQSIPDAPIDVPQPVQLAPSPLAETPLPTLATRAPAEEPPNTAISKPGLALWPWILAAFALAASGLFLLLRRKPRETYVGGSQFDLPTPDESDAAPAARPQMQVRAAAPPPVPEPAAPSGIVAAGLRPTIEIGIHPLRCVIDDDRVTIEFEVELFNTGTAPARSVIAEASLLNAGAMQGEQLAEFFANPIGAGERLDAIAPMSRVAFSSQVVARRSAIEEYDLAGRKAFVPVIAFNALYQWGSRKAQTSTAYLVGRETRGDKLAPFHLDGRQQEIRDLGARALPATVKT